ncbi:hypothetical protein C8R47DRAFT_1294658 [Mycena vitilis]|nr:hypothetical protein C8R47DRAFT_1294658 [Mycena vitilis]
MSKRRLQTKDTASSYLDFASTIPPCFKTIPDVNLHADYLGFELVAPDERESSLGGLPLSFALAGCVSGLCISFWRPMRVPPNVQAFARVAVLWLLSVHSGTGTTGEVEGYRRFEGLQSTAAILRIYEMATRRYLSKDLRRAKGKVKKHKLESESEGKANIGGRKSGEEPLNSQSENLGRQSEFKGNAKGGGRSANPLRSDEWSKWARNSSCAPVN